MKHTCILALAFVALLAGCSPYTSSSRSYPKYQARTAFKVYPAEVVSIKPVQIDGTYTRLGTYGGGAIGYTVGRTVGDGGGSRIAGAVGGVAGAVAGRAVEEAATREKGFEITVLLDNGDIIAIVQAADQTFTEGEKVRVLMGPDGSARVSKI